MPIEVDVENVKHTLGQFNTTQKDFILHGFEGAVAGRKWIDPFAGDGDLLNWVMSHGAKEVVGYDIDREKCSNAASIEWNDSLTKPRSYRDSWVIMNPPYLTRGRNKDKSLYNLHAVDDLYKVAILTLGGACGGIMIVPSNFLSSPRSRSVREQFFRTFRMMQCRVFEQVVFDDTECPVCACLFERREKRPDVDSVCVEFVPNGKKLDMSISQKYGWIFGQEYYEWIDGVDVGGIKRLMETDLVAGDLEGDVFVGDTQHVERRKFSSELLKSIICVKVTDSRSLDDRIRCEDLRAIAACRAGHLHPVLVSTKSSRHWAQMVFASPPPIMVQEEIIALVNQKIAELYKTCNAVCFTSYRSPATYGTRKRVCVEDMYKLISKARQVAERKTENK